MPEQQRQYWAFGANPKTFNIGQAIQELSEDTWTVPGRNVRAGDRAIIWKFKGNEKDRGIFALAEVLTDPVSKADPVPDYWVDQQAANQVVDRVRVRYYVPPALPLMMGAMDLPILRELSVARATGGTVFHVTPEQWETIMKLVGGWPGLNSNMQEAERAIEEIAGKQRSRQRFSNNADVRRVIEQYAMEKAKAFYEERGWKVTDVSSTHSYDLLCTADGKEELHVEVKGTTSDGSQLLLTANEVRHARDHYPNVALFVVSQIQVDPMLKEKPQGGEFQLLEPWNIDKGVLSPLAFRYDVL